MRLLTLTGPGGVGKTRLALEAARAVEADFADGAHFVSLAAVERPQDVPAAIVSALAIVPLAGESAEQAVERFLAAKHLLLVVDNCEHLPGAPRRSSAGCRLRVPAVTVLATSREPLAVQAEQLLPGAAARAARARDARRRGAVADVDAVALFCERARAHDPGFELGDGNAGRGRGDLPARRRAAAGDRARGRALRAALARARSPTRLDDALERARRGPRDAPARQQTLRATIDWSHDLLDDDEQACFARFAVFAGGATVRGGRDDHRRRPRHARPARRQEPARAPPRRDTDRPGSGCSRRSGPTPPSASRPCRTAKPCASATSRYFLVRSLGTTGPIRRSTARTRREHLARLDAEIENLRAALRWAAERDAAERVLELSAALVDYWMRRDRYAEAVDWVLPALRELGTPPPIRRCAPAHCCKVCWPLWALGRSG